MLGRAAALSAFLVACCLAPGAARATSYGLLPGAIELGTTQEFATPVPTGSAILTLTGSPLAPDAATLVASVDLGSAVILNPDETSLVDMHATLTGSSTDITLTPGFELEIVFDDLLLTIDGGDLSAIFFEGRDFASAPLAVAVPSTAVVLSGILSPPTSFTLPLDLEIPVPGYPGLLSDNGPASLVLSGSLVFEELPEPGATALLALAGVLARLRLRQR